MAYDDADEQKNKITRRQMAEIAISINRLYASVKLHFRDIRSYILLSQKSPFKEDFADGVESLANWAEIIVKCLSDANHKISEQELENHRKRLAYVESFYRPLIEVSAIKSLMLFSTETPEANRLYCIEHLKCLNILQTYIDAIERHTDFLAIFPPTTDIARGAVATMESVRARMEVECSRTMAAITSPVITISQKELRDWPYSLGSIVFDFVFGVMDKLHTASAGNDSNSGTTAPVQEKKTPENQKEETSVPVAKEKQVATLH